MNHPRTTQGAPPSSSFGLEGRPGSRCDNLRPGAARILLLLLAGVTLFLVLAGRRTPAPQATGQVPKTAFTDSDMHGLVIERLRRGESYYDALGLELRRNGFSPRPVFHWRTPAFFWALARMRNSYMARALLMVLVLIGVKFSIHELRLRGGAPAMAVGAVFLIPLFALALDSKWVLEPEPWVAALILLSLAVYARHPAAAVACGLAALTLRELALLYVLVMLAFAVRERRHREALAWSLGVLGFFIYFGIHAWLVLRHTLPGDASDPNWLRFGGAAQVVACSSYLLLGQGPHWLNAILTVLAVTGLASRKELDRLLVVVLAYMATFALVGKPWNWYWGIIYLPLLAIGLGHAFGALGGLVRASLAAPCAASFRQHDLKEQE
jgi:hypothetical protein